MAEKALVEGLVGDAIELVKVLDLTPNKPTLVVWYFYDDAAEWRLLISAPAFDVLVSKNEALAYQKVSEAITKADLHSLSISLVKIISSNDALPKTLKWIISTGPDGVSQAHFSDTTINGIFIKEMVVLRSA